MHNQSDDLDAAWGEYNEAHEAYVLSMDQNSPALSNEEHDALKAKINEAQSKINKIYMEIQAEAVAQATPVKSSYAVDLYHPSVYLPIKTAPKNGTIIMLLVDKGVSDVSGFYDNEDLYWTIGFNNFGDTEDDYWEFVDWDGGNDAFISALCYPKHAHKKLEIIGWKPFPKLTKGEPK